MDEKEKIMEKRSSFRGWKERNKGKISRKWNIIGIVIVLLVFSALIIYPYLNKTNSSPIKDKKKAPPPTTVKKVNLSNNSKNSSLKVVNTTKNAINMTNATKKVINMTNATNKIVIGNIGVPLVNKGFEITVKSVTPTIFHVNAWISVRNKGNEDKQFKLGSGTILIDNIGQQYENIHVTRSAEIFQTNLSAQSVREGAVFFERLKEGRSPKMMTLDINGEKVEFMLNRSSSK